ncbi:MAG: ATP-binding cassette domain-containing protein, partial [Psychrobacter alimentarius]
MKTSAFSSNKQSASPTDTHAIDDKTQLLSLQNVSYYIGQQRLLSDIDIDIAVNETVSLVGPNGAGKSTLVKLILGLIDPTKGGIKAHQPLQLGYVPQRFTVPPILPLRVSDLLGQANKTRLTPEQR